MMPPVREHAVAEQVHEIRFEEDGKGQGVFFRIQKLWEPEDPSMMITKIHHDYPGSFLIDSGL